MKIKSFLPLYRMLFFMCVVLISSVSSCQKEENGGSTDGILFFEYIFPDGLWEERGCVGEQPSSVEVEEVKQLISNQFYPLFNTAFIQKELTSIVLTKNLKFTNGGDIAGVFINENRIVIDVTDCRVHYLVHELFHSVDFNHNSQTFNNNFSGFNSVSYSGYNIGEGKSHHCTNSKCGHTYFLSPMEQDTIVDGKQYGLSSLLEQGFVTNYSKASYLEDFAEFSSAMILIPEKMRLWSEEYPLIKGKYDLLLERFDQIGLEYEY